MTRGRANLLLTLAAVLWGAGNVAQKTVLDDLGPTLTLGLRSLIGLLVISPWVLRELSRTRQLTLSQWRAVLASAVLFCLALGFQQRAYLSTSVTNASFFVNTTVVFTPMFAWLMIREHPRFVTLPATALALCGVLLMGGGLSGLGLGDAYCLISAVLYAVWIAIVAMVTRTSDQPFTLAAAQFGLTALLGTSIGLLCEPVGAGALVGAAPELFVLGVFSTGVAFTLQALAQRVTPATDAAIILSGESLFGAVAASIFLGEEMTPTSAVGAALILFGILLVQIPNLRSGALTLRSILEERIFRRAPLARTQSNLMVEAEHASH